MATKFIELVKDWGGFEQLVAKLHDTGTVSVQHNVTLTGKSGAPRQVDVLVTHTEGLYTHRILVECKHWNKPVERAQIDAMISSVEDLSAAKGVLFTTQGYQSGAKTMAGFKGIEIFKVRELTEDEWGAPGRVIDLFLQVVALAYGNLALPGAVALTLPGNAPPEHLALAIIGGETGFESKTPIRMNGKDGTLEGMLEKAGKNALDHLAKLPVTFNGGAAGVYYLKVAPTLVFEPAMELLRPNALPAICPKLTCEVGIRIDQSRIIIDRSDNYLFALAIEDCISGTVHAASRAKDKSVSVLAPLPARASPESAQVADTALKPNTLMRVVVRPLFDFSELAGKESVPWPQLPSPPKET